MLTNRSDHQNPELAVKQILAIAPILQGQKVSHEFEIPPRSAGKDKATDDSGNPIDFAGENAASQDRGASSSGSGLVEPPQPSQSQQPGNPLQRRDTNTKEVDEFVDAKEQ